ncbi:MAG: AGE family epimerase/isomerase [Phaeodactylibacter sp.]|nr:AGE family epimerase/isomerase [Phaeodactylibacter sp.]MCB9274175.1 AGE family epimerase/isomerase [Lewinellaceae bacterium]
MDKYRTPPYEQSVLTTGLVTAAEEELEAILGWWAQRMPDRENGGFYGRIDGKGRLHPHADKGVILHTRILWSFAAAARVAGQADYRSLADQAYRYLMDNFRDPLHGGVFWMLDYQGAPLQGRKQVYAQAFAIYALAEYFALTGSETALEAAFELFWLVEKYSRDLIRGGYYEAFEQDWRPAADLRLSDKEPQAAKTMNTHLHVLEAYTRLYEVSKDEAVKEGLLQLAYLMHERFLDAGAHSLHLFFTEQWECLSDEISFGHNIEYSWLSTEAAIALKDDKLFDTVGPAAVRMADTVLRTGIDNEGALANEARPGKGITDPDKHWWPQAEAVVGFINAWQLSGENRFLEAALNCWAFIEKRVKAPKLGEWYWGVGRDGQPMESEDIAGPWKAPYHNSRMCLETMKRMGSVNGRAYPG